MIQLDAILFAILFASGFLFERIGIIREALLIRDATVKNIRVVADKRVSDIWKEIFLRRNSIRTFGISLRLSLRIALFLGVILLPLLAIDHLAPGWDVFNYLITWRGIFISVLPFVVYYFLRKSLSRRES